MSHRMQDRWIAVGAGATLAMAATASGQAPGWNIEFIFAPGQTQITPRTPSCIVRLWARFSPNEFAFAGSQWSVHASDGEWSQNVVLEPVRIGQNPGTINGPSMTDIHAAQINFPGGHIFADPANPIAAWEGTWSTTDFTPRTVSISTETKTFVVYVLRGGSSRVSRLAGLVEGAAELEVSGCYPDCDTSTGLGVLDIFDFLCFQKRYAANDPYACDCDTQTGPAVCDVFDFLCFQSAYAAGCP